MSKEFTVFLYTLLQGCALITWIGGIVLAQGATSTFFAVILPFYAWYLFIEALMLRAGLI